MRYFTFMIFCRSKLILNDKAHHQHQKVLLHLLSTKPGFLVTSNFLWKLADFEEELSTRSWCKWLQIIYQRKPDFLLFKSMPFFSAQQLSFLRNWHFAWSMRKSLTNITLSLTASSAFESERLIAGYPRNGSSNYMLHFPYICDVIDGMNQFIWGFQIVECDAICGGLSGSRQNNRELSKQSIL